jgi:hypothetical protein
VKAVDVIWRIVMSKGKFAVRLADWKVQCRLVGSSRASIAELSS